MYDISAAVLNSWSSRKIVRDPLSLPSERVCTVATGALSTILSQTLELHVLVSPSLLIFLLFSHSSPTSCNQTSEKDIHP